MEYFAMLQYRSALEPTPSWMMTTPPDIVVD